MRPSKPLSDAPRSPLLKNALSGSQRWFAAVAVFSAFTNVLMLVSPIYMLQIYDRVLTSASHETLIALTVVAVFLLLCFGGLDWVRHRLMARVALTLNTDAMDHVLASAFQSSLYRSHQSSGQPVRDLDAVSQFIVSPPALAFFDAPWVPVFTAAIFLIHPWLGYLAIASAVVIFLLALMTEWLSRTPYRSAAEHGMHSNRFVEEGLRYSNVLQAMGMFNDFRRRWRNKHDRSVVFQARGAARLGALLSTSKSFRQIVQVGVLGLGAYLVLRQEITPGMMIAASIILGRALAPIEQGMSAWRGFVNARQAWQRLNMLLRTFPPESDEGTSLPRPEGVVEVKGLTAAAPGMIHPVLKGVSFTLQAGSVSALIGPSGSGKSTLVRILVGVWPAQNGSVRLDGANINEWPLKSRFWHVGYMPQEVELFEGSVAENIARLSDPDDGAVQAAANLAHCHEVIMRLPDNYDAMLVTGGTNLSAGQRQQVGLARAMYGDPALVVLDEPDANLGDEGKEALMNTLRVLTNRGVTVLLVTHNLDLLQAVENVLVLRDGVLVAAGHRDEVLRQKKHPTPQLVKT